MEWDVSKKVISSPMAIVKVGGQPVGKMRNIRCTETMRRARVVGLGEALPSELPLLEWSGTLTAGMFAIRTNAGIFNAIDRSGTDVQAFIHKVLFNEGISLDIYIKKPLKEHPQIPQGDPPRYYELVTFASINGVVLASEGFDLADGQIGGRDGTFEYMTPILYGV